MTVLARGEFAQTVGKPTTTARSPATVNLGNSVVNTNLNSIGGNNLALGQEVMADSLPVVIASNQSAVSVSQGIPLDLVSGTTSTTGTSSTQVIAAVTSKSIYIFSLSLSNSSATSVIVNLQDSSGGTTLASYELPAGGGNNVSSSIPLFKTTSGNGLFFQASSSATTIYVNASGISN